MKKIYACMMILAMIMLLSGMTHDSSAALRVAPEMEFVNSPPGHDIAVLNPVNVSPAPEYNRLFIATMRQGSIDSQAAGTEMIQSADVLSTDIYNYQDYSYRSLYTSTLKGYQYCDSFHRARDCLRQSWQNNGIYPMFV